MQPIYDTLQAWIPPTVITEKDYESPLSNPSELFALDRKWKAKRITHLKGNVRELTATNGITYGGSFIDSCKRVQNTRFYSDTILVDFPTLTKNDVVIKHKTIKQNILPNYYTGFRCICRYKKWK